MEEENGGCGTNMADLKKSLKESRYDRVNPNKKMDESNKRSLLLQSEAMDNANNGSRRPIANPLSHKHQFWGKWEGWGGLYVASSYIIGVGTP